MLGVDSYVSLYPRSTFSSFWLLSFPSDKQFLPNFSKSLPLPTLTKTSPNSHYQLPYGWIQEIFCLGDLINGSDL